MSRLLPAIVLAFFVSQAWSDSPADRTPQLLLSTKLLRRLKRDRDRQTVRWLAFENRVKTVPDSPQRGFELALYFAITGDQDRGKEALAWAAAHPCEFRQNALIHDWVGGDGAPTSCAKTTTSLRDQAFIAVLSNGDLNTISGKTRQEFIPRIVRGGIKNSSALYEAIELITVLRENGGGDVRHEAAQFFRNLPTEFLLSLTPEQVEQPDWMTHVAALAAVNMDPNLEASQFLQGWAMEGRQRLRDGPGVGYELLWADPYLPGVAYQNLDPWIYDGDGQRLFARTDWEQNSCWISISMEGVRDLNCPSGWQDKITEFGSLRLIPMALKCLDIPRQDPRKSLVIWKLRPRESLVWREKKDKAENRSEADEIGLWHPGTNVEGRVCRR